MPTGSHLDIDAIEIRLWCTHGIASDGSNCSNVRTGESFLPVRIRQKRIRTCSLARVRTCRFWLSYIVMVVVHRVSIEEYTDSCGSGRDCQHFVPGGGQSP